MDSTNSIAEGVFAFNPLQKKTGKCRKAQHEFDSFKNEDWYESFETVWGSIQEKIDAEEKKVLSNLMAKVDTFLHNIAYGSDTIPTVIMLTGVNMSDHKKLFSNIDDYLLKESDYSHSYTATLWANECTSVRNMIEFMVIQFLSTHEEPDQMEDWEEDSDCEERQNISVKRSNQTLPHLVNWFNNLMADETELPPKKKSKIENGVGGSHPRLIVIIPDFEAHNEKVLQDFILILSGYLPKLPTLILMFGVASMISAVHDSLPSHVISKLSFEFFKTPQSVDFLNSTLDSVFLTSECNFMLSGKVLQFLTDAFLWYDFSLEGFIRSLKFCVMDHFYNSTVAQYCWPREDLSDVILSLDGNKILELRKVQSFVDWVEKRRQQKDHVPLKTEQFPVEICDLLKDLHKSIRIFYIGLRCLQILVQDLPQKPIDSNLRNLYIKAITTRITETQQYKDSIKTLGFTSRCSMLERLEKMMHHLKKHTSYLTVKKCYNKVKMLHCKLENASVTASMGTRSPTKNSNNVTYNKRTDLVNIIHNMAQKSMTDFEVARREALDILTKEVFNELLIQLSKLPFHEAYIYNKESTVKEHMVGALRADLYRALNNPQEHLQCGCCKLKDQTQIVKNMPDICIVYKLHLRWGSLINIYDWMQSFKAVLEPESDDDHITPEIQARFTQAVAALQFLGYIKYSNAKKDHVARLTVDS